MDETVKNPGNMKPRRVAMLDMAEKEGKKKVSGVTMEKDIQGCSIPRGLSGDVFFLLNFLTFITIF